MFNIILAAYEIENDEERDLVMQLYATYAARVKAYAWSYLRNPQDAEDALSNTFLRVIRHRNKFVGIDEAATKRLLILYTRCACIDIYRKQMDEPIEAINNALQDDEGNLHDRELPDDVNILGDMVKHETIGKLKEAIDSLESPAREIVLLKYSHDMLNTEIAELTGINPSTVSTILQRSLAKIRKKLEGDVYETK